jgi:O-6-methylguanine DNA methyltransferase
MSAPAPLGLLFLARTERGLRYVEFLDRKSIRRVIASHAEQNPGAEWVASLLELREITAQLEAYFHGSLRGFEVPLDPAGEPLEQEVWRALKDIPFATTRTVAEIAKAVGQPRAAQAVRLAIQQNPIAIVVPGHRVAGGDGKLASPAGGLPRRKWLVEHEARFGRATVLPGEITETLHVPVVEAPRPRPVVAPRPVAAVVARSAKKAAAARNEVRARTSRAASNTKSAKPRTASSKRRVAAGARSGSRAGSRRRS